MPSHRPNKIMSKKHEKVGLWMVGAAGGVASTVALGVAALRKGLADTTGLVSALPPFDHLGLVDPGSLTVGGHEVRSVGILDSIQQLRERSNLFTEDLVRKCTPILRSFQANIRPGTLYGSSAVVRKLVGDSVGTRDASPVAAIDRLAADIVEFRRKNNLDRVVVIHLASSEPIAPKATAHASYGKLERSLAKKGSRVLPASSLYALAAIDAGCPFVNFTPSLGIAVPAIRQRADEMDVCYMGRDGKTGETLVKSVLAPLFATRNLRVLSWVGQNILGNHDGLALRDPKVRLAKIRSKDKSVTPIVGGSPTTLVSIDYVPSLDDWKVAWDFIHFQGFLKTKMSMQFTWQGSDSILAAPLVIDLARFAAHEHRTGRSGAMRHLACFFKDPLEVRKHDHASQWRMLLDHFESSGTRQP